MKQSSLTPKDKNVGFISTRIAGTDGVSLETAKWATVFEKEGFKTFFMAGELDTPPERSYLLEEAHFSHPEVRDIYENCFGVTLRGRYITDKIHALKDEIKDHIYQFIGKFNITIVVPENILTIPLNIPLGLALTEVIAEIGIPTIAHHHDFFWERQRFLNNAIWEYLNMAFPPHIPFIKHVTINSSADNQLSLRTGISATIIPNVMDFENPPPPIDDYASDVRKSLGIDADELFILQPTRVVKRKGIEHAIEFVSRMKMKSKFVISHASGDEGYGYENRIRHYSELMKVDTIFVSDIINEQRGLTRDGGKIYTLEDIYPHADLVTYPSNFEGFGNAFLEAVYFRKPIVVNNYSIYSVDIKPKGFSVIELDGFVTEEALEEAQKILSDPELRQKMVQHNYEVANNFFSYEVLQSKLKNLIEDLF